MWVCERVENKLKLKKETTLKWLDVVYIVALWACMFFVCLFVSNDDRLPESIVSLQKREHVLMDNVQCLELDLQYLAPIHFCLLAVFI